MSMILPVIGVPIGDPAGIGPEIAIKAALTDEIRLSAHIKLIGPLEVFNQVRNHFNFSFDKLDIHYIEGSENQVLISDVGKTSHHEYGKIQANCGLIAYDSIKEAVRLALDGTIDAIATTPINKEAFRAAKISSIGHTELLGELTNTSDPVTMFHTNTLKIFFLTRHISLIKACETINYEKVLSGIIRTYESLLLLDKYQPERAFAVAGLNPHNGEHGLFGNEEEESIVPAIIKAQEMGIPVEGPVPADSVFYQARTGKYSAVLALYHDQGHIAAKTYDFEKTISLTLGLPFLRTSVDHGTAFDLAGKGIAQYNSMVQAIRIAAEYAFIYKENYMKIKS